MCMNYTKKDVTISTTMWRDREPPPWIPLPTQRAYVQLARGGQLTNAEIPCCLPTCGASRLGSSMVGLNAGGAPRRRWRSPQYWACSDTPISTIQRCQSMWVTGCAGRRSLRRPLLQWRLADFGLLDDHAGKHQQLVTFNAVIAGPWRGARRRPGAIKEKTSFTLTTIASLTHYHSILPMEWSGGSARVIRAVPLMRSASPIPGIKTNSRPICGFAERSRSSVPTSL